MRIAFLQSARKIYIYIYRSESRKIGEIVIVIRSEIVPHSGSSGNSVVTLPRGVSVVRLGAQQAEPSGCQCTCRPDKFRPLSVRTSSSSSSSSCAACEPGLREAPVRNIMPRRGLTLAVLPPAAITYTRVPWCNRATTPLHIRTRARVIFSSTERSTPFAAVRAPKRLVVVVVPFVVSIVS